MEKGLRSVFEYLDWYKIILIHLSVVNILYIHFLIQKYPRGGRQGYFRTYRWMKVNFVLIQILEGLLERHFRPFSVYPNT